MDVLNPSGESNMHSENTAKENGSAAGNLAGDFGGYAQVNGVSNGHKEHKSDKKDKHRDKERDKEKDKLRDKDKHRDKDKEKSKHSSSSSKEKHSSSSKDKDRSDKKDRSDHKSSSSSKDKDRDKEKSSSSSSKDKDKDKDKHKSSSSSTHKSSSKDKEKSSKDGEHRSKDKDRDKERNRDKERGDKDKEKSKDKERNKDKERSDKDKERSKDKERNKEKERSDKDRERSKDKYKDHDKERSKDKLKSEKSHRDKDKPRDKEKDKSRSESDHKHIKAERLSNDFQVKQEVDSPVKNHKFEMEDVSPVIKQEKLSCNLNDSSFTRPDDMTFKEEAGSTEDEGYHDTAKTFKQEASDSEEDVSLGHRLKVSNTSGVKRKIESEDEEEDMPLMARAPVKKVKKEKEAKKKRKSSDDEGDFKPAVKKTKKAKSVKSEAPSPRKKKKEEEEQEVWKWWEEEKKEDGVKWNFLEHKGPLFAPPYEPLPPNVKFSYDGKEIRLSEPAEEVATFYAKMIEHEYTTKDVFNKNFFKDWRRLMTDSERSLITDLSKCNFKPMHKYFVEQSEIRKAMSKEEKKALKDKNDEIQKEMGFCKIDGHTEKIGNFRIEPPGLFRGRGEHPKMGMLKRRVEPEDVIINCSKGSKIPVAPEGHRWKEVRHDNKVTWLASWTENVQGQVKYVMLNPSSKLKGEKDWQKYEIARKLAKSIDKIREDYRADWKSKEMRIRQRAVAMYFIDKLALRAGNEKDEDQADTVGCCSLRVEHIELLEEKDGKEFVVVFDFLGKDSIRYYNEVPVEKRVFKNVQLFMENKKPGDDLFDRLNTSVLNKYLSDLMEGLTAKVFRTYNASWTLQQQLDQLTNPDDTLAEKILSYNRANRAVAILCNHQRSIPKSHDKSMENLKGKIEAKRDQVKEAEKAYKDLKKDKSRSVSEKILLDKKKKALDRLREQLNKLEIQETDREENKTIALGTSKLNYLDPRISVAWCKKHDVPIEKIYNKTQRDKFRWAIDMAGPDYVF